MKGLLLIRYSGFSAFLIPEICSLFFAWQGRDTLLASFHTVKSHKVKLRATRSGSASVKAFLAVQRR